MAIYNPFSGLGGAFKSVGSSVGNFLYPFQQQKYPPIPSPRPAPAPNFSTNTGQEIYVGAQGLLPPSASNPRPTTQYSQPIGPLPRTAPTGSIPSSGYPAPIGPLPATAPVGSAVSNNPPGYIPPASFNPYSGIPGSQAYTPNLNYSPAPNYQPASGGPGIYVPPPLTQAPTGGLPDAISTGQLRQIEARQTQPPINPIVAPPVGGQPQPGKAPGTGPTPETFSVGSAQAPSAASSFASATGSGAGGSFSGFGGMTTAAGGGGLGGSDLYSTYATGNKAEEDKLDALLAELQKQSAPGEEEQGLQKQVNALEASRQLGLTDIQNKPIPLPFITGQQNALERRAGALQTPLLQQLGVIQARRQASVAGAKTALEYAQEKAKRRQEAQKLAWEQTYKQQELAQQAQLKQAELQKQTSDIQEYNFAKQQGYTGSFVDYQREMANLKAKASGAGALTAAQQQSTINQIMSQFDNEPVVRNYNLTAEGYQFATSLANKQNPTSSDDQGLIYAFAKAMDPNSVVREGEYATVQKYAQSWAQSFGFKVERIFSNQPFLSAAARQNMVQTIASKFAVSQKNYQNVYSEYQRRINDAKSGVVGGSITNYAAAFPQQQNDQYAQARAQLQPGEILVMSPDGQIGGIPEAEFTTSSYSEPASGWKRL